MSTVSIPFNRTFRQFHLPIEGCETRTAEGPLTADLYDFFDMVAVISLERRLDRWQQFKAGLPSNWPFRPPVRFLANDGSGSKPDCWKESAGAWGCYQSHMSVLRVAIERGAGSVLILEDDAEFCPNFSEDVRSFLNALPPDWELVYLGGEHIELHQGQPQQINERVYRPYNVNRMHAYALRGAESMQRIYAYLSDEANWTTKQHVDHFMGGYQKQEASRVYVPDRWLVAQHEGASDIALQPLGFRKFIDTQDVCHAKTTLPMVAVMGPFSSGTSAMAGALHQLGINMGRKFETPDRTNYRGHFEAADLARICRCLYEEPWLLETSTRAGRITLLRLWAANHAANSQNNHQLVGGKHPSFCLMGHELVEAWNNPFVISVERSVNDIQNSLARREWGWPIEACLLITEQLVAAREAFLMNTTAPIIRVPYGALLAEPAAVLSEVCDFLNYFPAPANLSAAANFINK